MPGKGNIPFLGPSFVLFCVCASVTPGTLSKHAEEESHMTLREMFLSTKWGHHGVTSDMLVAGLFSTLVNSPKEGIHSNSLDPKHTESSAPTYLDNEAPEPTTMVNYVSSNEHISELATMKDASDFSTINVSSSTSNVSPYNGVTASGIEQSAVHADSSPSVQKTDMSNIGQLVDLDALQPSEQVLFARSGVSMFRTEASMKSDAIQSGKLGQLLSDPEMLSISDMKGLPLQTQFQNTHQESSAWSNAVFPTTSLSLVTEQSTIQCECDSGDVIWTSPILADMVSRRYDSCCSGVTIVSMQTLASVLSPSPPHAVLTSYDFSSQSVGDTLLPTTTFSTVALQSSSGFITTPGFKDNGTYPPNVNETHCFNLSENETLLLSFPYFHLEGGVNYDCRYDYLKLFSRDGKNESNVVWTKCDFQMIPADMFNMSSVCLLFHSDISFARKGVNITYSILPKSVEAIKGDNGLFNCSALTPFHRSLHFDCNLVQECHDKQDEQHCNYISSECSGLVTLGNSTCVTTAVRNNITWFDANKQCNKDNRILVSPKTPEQWENFVNVLESSRKTVSVYIGLHTTVFSPTMSYFYRNGWQWSSQHTAFYISSAMHRAYYYWSVGPTCAIYSPSFGARAIVKTPCSRPSDTLVMCQMRGAMNIEPGEEEFANISIQNTFNLRNKSGLAECSSKHFTQNYLECDLSSHCHDHSSQEECQKQASNPAIELFACSLSSDYFVHYTLVCDYRSDCPDGSDESFCQHEKCTQDMCNNGQCIDYGQRCNGIPQCTDNSDEICPRLSTVLSPAASLPVTVDYTDKGVFTVEPRNVSEGCPQTHFQCRNQDCLPVYLRCNKQPDCPGGEDEQSVECGKSSCPGFYRCMKSNVCLHPDSVCDGIPHCPFHDDEALCNYTCPSPCTCQGLAFTCTSTFSFHLHPALRYLHIESSNVTAVDVTSNTYLVLLRLSHCQLKKMSVLKLDKLSNLRTLDVRDNMLMSVNLNIIQSLPNLQYLYLSGNPLHTIDTVSIMQNELTIDLSFTSFESINDTTFHHIPGLKMLNMSFSKLNVISTNAFKSVMNLEELDLRETPLRSFSPFMLLPLSKLKCVQTSDFRLCCSSALPDDFDPTHCQAPQDQIASCNDLLRSPTYRAFLWIIAVFALMGNAGSFVARVFLARESSRCSFSVFVLNLCVSDFLMGVYMAMIGAADSIFRGEYWWRADIWKKSAACKTAGFLSLLSSEVSAFFIFLITVDRFLVLHFPFGEFCRSFKSSWAACLVVWFVGVILAGVPLLPFTSGWNFYGQTSICLPLPFSGRRTFPGYYYSFSIMIVLNFVLFLLIAVGQALIYCSVRTKRGSKLRKNVKSADAAVARRLITIVLTDFLCWFPTGLLGLLAFTGHTIHTEINITVAVFVMPFNAALNPFLYTLNLLMERRRKAAEARMMLRMQATLRSETCDRTVWVTTQLQNRTCPHNNDCQGDDPKLPLDLASGLGNIDKEAALKQINRWLNEGLLLKSEIVSLGRNK